MEIIKNKKNFKVIRLTFEERCHLEWGSICMRCGNSVFVDDAYYIAVLNDIMCEDCYNEWLESAINYAEDGDVEDYNFSNTKLLLEQMSPVEEYDNDYE